MVAFNLRNLNQVLLELLARTWSAAPALGFVDNGLNDSILYHCLDIYGVVHISEDTASVQVKDAQVLEHL